MAHLKNDTVINVSQLLKEHVGEFRVYDMGLGWFALDSDIVARDIVGQLRLTRIVTGLLATVEMQGTALVECVRCLEIYEEPFQTTFDQEFQPSIDVRTGVALDAPDPTEDVGIISPAHELDLAESIRQEALVALPMRPTCGENCPGPDVPEDADADAGDPRLQALEELLNDEHP